MTKYKLTINDTIQLAAENDIQYEYTKKLYYKKYAFNLTLTHPSIWHQHLRGASMTDIADIRTLH